MKVPSEVSSGIGLASVGGHGCRPVLSFAGREYSVPGCFFSLLTPGTSCRSSGAPGTPRCRRRHRRSTPGSAWRSPSGRPGPARGRRRARCRRAPRRCRRGRRATSVPSPSMAIDSESSTSPPPTRVVPTTSPVEILIGVDDRVVAGVVDRVREVLVLGADHEAARLLDARVADLADLLRLGSDGSRRDDRAASTRASRSDRGVRGMRTIMANAASRRTRTSTRDHDPDHQQGDEPGEQPDAAPRTDPCRPSASSLDGEASGRRGRRRGRIRLERDAQQRRVQSLAADEVGPAGRLERDGLAQRLVGQHVGADQVPASRRPGPRRRRSCAPAPASRRRCTWRPS